MQQTRIIAKFSEPQITAAGEPRARVALTGLTTLWFNTGTLCNLACEHCYIESSPKNDALVYLSRAEAGAYLDEIEAERLPVARVGFTGGEPFMNPDFLGMLDDALGRGYRVSVLTNAMRPMMKCADALTGLKAQHGANLNVRVSVDHYRHELHERERGPRSFAPMLRGLQWLSAEGFDLTVAGRTLWGGEEAALREGFARLFADHHIAVDAWDPERLILFPEMDPDADVPEITEACWATLGVDPASVMCASERMVVKRRGAAAPEVVACTLLPYAPEFSLGARLADALGSVGLNHPHCAKFCVLGGGSCSG